MLVIVLHWTSVLNPQIPLEMPLSNGLYMPRRLGESHDPVTCGSTSHSREVITKMLVKSRIQNPMQQTRTFYGENPLYVSFCPMTSDSNLCLWPSCWKKLWGNSWWVLTVEDDGEDGAELEFATVTCCSDSKACFKAFCLRSCCINLL